MRIRRTGLSSFALNGAGSLSLLVLAVLSCALLFPGHAAAQVNTSGRVETVPPDGVFKTVGPPPAVEVNPNAKWACDQTEVKQPPVWRGVGKLTFDFYIRNEGTENLTIKAKGG